MRIAILTWTTRGEVQPYVSLGCELKRRGHHVVLAVNENHLEWASRTGLSIAPLPLDFNALMTGSASAKCFTAGEPRTFLAWLSAYEHTHRRAIQDAMIDACAEADVIVSGPLLSHRAATIAEAFGAAFVGAFIYPVTPTAAYVSPYLANGMPHLPRAKLRLQSHLRAQAVFSEHQRPGLEELRKRLGLPSLAGSVEGRLADLAVSIVHLFDELVLPRPDDWPSRCVVGGYCFLSKETRERLGEQGVDGDLESWLQAGKSPIFVGFGSMPVAAPNFLLRLVEDVCRDLGTRAVIGAGWSDIAATRSRDMVVVKAVDHDALLPRCAAAVHHGGAGTTATSLAAGIPTVICSVFADQPLWGYRVAALGVGGTMPFQRLDRGALRQALGIALQPEMRNRARALGKELCAKDGCGLSADLLLDAVSGRARTADMQAH